MKRFLFILLICMILFSSGCYIEETATPASLPKPEDTPIKTAAGGITPKATQTEAAFTELSLEEQAEYIISGMTVEEKLGQLIFTDVEETEIDDISAAYIKSFEPGGICFGRQNFQTIEQTLKLVSDLNALCDIPLIITCTQEGGRIMRTAYGEIPTTPLPPLYDIGSTGDYNLAYRAGEVLAAELLSLGVNLDFAPVADVWSNPENTVISDRSFGSDPKLVAEMTRAMVLGMKQQGIGTTLKHFPGHGSTSEDSHKEFAYCYSTLEQLKENEMIPFIAGIEAGADAVMTAHVIYPNIIDSGEPATVSYYFLTELLRNELGFGGLIITDSMKMLGMTDYCDIPTACVMSLKAGADVLLVPQENLADVFARLKSAADSGEISAERINESVKRILLFKINHRLFDESYELPDPYETIGRTEHLQVVEEISALIKE